MYDARGPKVKDSVSANYRSSTTEELELVTVQGPLSSSSKYVNEYVLIPRKISLQFIMTVECKESFNMYEFL